MSPAVDITGDSIENNAIIINEEDDFLAVTHKASGTRLLVDRNTDLSDLWDAFDQGIETSEFWQDDGSGIAELLSQYNGINTPSVKTDSINSDGDLNIQSNSDLNQNDIKNAGSVEAELASVTKNATRLTMRSSSGAKRITIPTNTVVQLDLDTIDYDNLGIADLDNNKMTISDDGVYLITSTVSWEADSGWTTGDDIRCNPNVQDQTRGFAKAGTGDQMIQHTTLQTLSAGSDIFLQARQDSGDDKNVIADTLDRNTHIEVARI